MLQSPVLVQLMMQYLTAKFPREFFTASDHLRLIHDVDSETPATLSEINHATLHHTLNSSRKHVFQSVRIASLRGRSADLWSPYVLIELNER